MENNSIGTIKTKKLADFELLEINLIPDQPFEYGYVMLTNKRAIQKRNQEELELAAKENALSITYIKEKPNEDFIPFGSKPQHLEWIVQTQNNKHLFDLKTRIIFASFIAIWFIIYLIFSLYSEGKIMLDFDNILYGYYVIYFLLPIGLYFLKKKLGIKIKPQFTVKTIWWRDHLRQNRFRWKVLILPLILTLVYVFQYVSSYDPLTQSISSKSLNTLILLRDLLIQPSVFQATIVILLTYYLNLSIALIFPWHWITLVFISTGMIGLLTYRMILDLPFTGSIFAIAGLSGMLIVVIIKFPFMWKVEQNRILFSLMIICLIGIFATNDFIILGFLLGVVMLGMLFSALIPKKIFLSSFKS